MKLPVLVEPVSGNGYAARVGPPFNWSAEGKTPEEAVANLQREADRHLTNGQKVATIDVPDAEHPLLKWAGKLDLNDPVVQEWQRIIEENRRAADNDPNVF